MLLCLDRECLLAETPARRASATGTAALLPFERTGCRVPLCVGYNLFKTPLVGCVLIGARLEPQQTSRVQLQGTPMDTIYALCLVTLLGKTTATNSDTVLRCEAPAVLKGDQGTVTCFFNRDIGETREDFVIQKSDSKGNSQGLVLNCYWLEPHGLPSCEIVPGYDFDKQVSDKVTLVIREATEDAVGTYVCQVVPAEHDLSEAKCSFTLKESTSLSTSHPKDKTSTNRPEENKKSQFQAWYIVVPVLCILLLILVAFIIRRRSTIQQYVADQLSKIQEWWRPRGNKPKPEEDLFLSAINTAQQPFPTKKRRRGPTASDTAKD